MYYSISCVFSIYSFSCVLLGQLSVVHNSVSCVVQNYVSCVLLGQLCYSVSCLLLGQLCIIRLVMYISVITVMNDSVGCFSRAVVYNMVSLCVVAFLLIKFLMIYRFFVITSLF